MISLLTSLVVVASVATSATPREASGPIATTAPATQPIAAPVGLTWRLSSSLYPGGIDDEAGYFLWLRARRDLWAPEVIQSAGLLGAVYEDLVPANMMLAWETEPFASRRLLGISRVGDEAAMRSALALVRKRLTAARANLADRNADGLLDTAPDHALYSTLSSFTTALEAVWSQGQDESALQAKRVGVYTLAVLLEHQRKDVASAAMLWQAVLYRQMGRLDKAFQLLPLATEPVDGDARRHQFFARLLRCRLVADRGGYAAAYSLLLRIERRIAEWFATEPAYSEATHAAMLIRLQVLEQWRDTLDPTTETGEIQWCNKAAARIRQALSTHGNKTQLLRLEQTIPLEEEGKRQEA